MPAASGGLNEPQAGDPQVAVQITPAAVGSLVTRAVIGSVWLTLREVGKGVVNETAIARGTMVRVKLLLCDGLLVTVAVIVIAVPIGTIEGAV